MELLIPFVQWNSIGRPCIDKNIKYFLKIELLTLFCFLLYIRTSAMLNSTPRISKDQLLSETEISLKQLAEQEVPIFYFVFSS